jgi:hypothetical protein
MKNEKVLRALESKNITFQQAKYIYNFDFQLPDVIGYLRRLNLLCKYYWEGEYVARKLFEEFFHFHAFITLHDISIKFSLPSDYFYNCLLALESDGLIYLPKNIPHDVLPDNIYNHLRNKLPYTRNVVQNEEEYSEGLRKSFSALNVPGYKVLHCDYHKANLATAYCSITQKPICNKCILYIDTNKPICYRPDYCALPFYFENKKFIKPFGGCVPEEIED